MDNEPLTSTALKSASLAARDPCRYTMSVLDAANTFLMPTGTSRDLETVVGLRDFHLVLYVPAGQALLVGHRRASFSIVMTSINRTIYQVEERLVGQAGFSAVDTMSMALTLENQVCETSLLTREIKHLANLLDTYLLEAFDNDALVELANAACNDRRIFQARRVSDGKTGPIHDTYRRMFLADRVRKV